MPGYFAPLAAEKYALLTTFRRDGAAVGTPVHLVAEDNGETAYFRTWDTTGKVKRLRHTTRVEVAPCNFRGRPTGPAILATATLLDDQGAARAAELLRRRHPLLHGVLIPRVHKLRGWKTLHYSLSTSAPGAEPRPA